MALNWRSTKVDKDGVPTETYENGAWRPVTDEEKSSWKDNSSTKGIPGGQVIDRVGKATGLTPPDNPLPPDKITKLFAPTTAKANEIYTRALDAQDAAAGWTGPREVIAPAPITAHDVVAPTISQGQQVTTSLVKAPTESTVNPTGTARTVGRAPTATDVQTTGTAPTRGTVDVRGTAPTQAQAVLAGPVKGFNAAQVAAPEDVVLNRIDTGVKADQMGPAAMIAKTAVSREGTSMAGADQARGSLAAAAADIRNAPSAAKSLFDASLAKIGRQQLGVAAQARGPERAAARREAILNIGERGMEAGATTAALSAQEEQAKRVGAAQVLTGLRTGDIDVARTGAQISADLNKVQADINAAKARGDAGAVNQLTQRQAELNLEARKSTVGYGLQQESTAADVAAGNEGRTLAANTTNAGLTQDARKYFATALNTRGDLEAERQTRVAEDNVNRRIAQEEATLGRQLTQDEAALVRRQAQEEAGLNRNLTQATGNVERRIGQEEAGLTRTVTQEQSNLDRAVNQDEADLSRGVQVATTNATQTNATNQANADRSQRGEIAGAELTATTNTGNANRDLQADTTNASNTLAATTTNATNDIAEQQTRQAGAVGGLGAATDAARLGAKEPEAQVDAATGQAKREEDADERLVKTVTSTGEKLSDERAKGPLKAISEADIMDLAEKMRMVSGRYKPGYADGGAEVHAMTTAQSLDRTPLGRQFTSKGPDGLERVDYDQLAALMAATALRAQKARTARG